MKRNRIGSNLKKVFAVVCIVVITASIAVWAEEGAPTAAAREAAQEATSDDEDAGTEHTPIGLGASDLPRIAIMDIVSSDFEEAKLKTITDVLRTELFKLHIFQVLERGIIEKVLDEHELNLSGMVSDADMVMVGEILSIEKLIICRMEYFSELIAINIRIIDVGSSLIDFTENVFINSEGELFAAIKEITGKIELYYVVKEDDSTPESRAAGLREKWEYIGAAPGEIEYLIAQNIKPEAFLDIRQYDITFDFEAFMGAVENEWDPELIKTFMRAGIPYPQVVTALEYGITNLTNYNTYFKPEGLTFEEYLDAYANHIVTADAYKRFKRGYRQDRAVLGIGGVAQTLPIATSDYRFILGKAGWEHFFTQYQRNLIKGGFEVGLFFLNGIPTPYAMGNFYIGKYPFYAKISAGVHAEIIIGGHFAANFGIGVEVVEHVEIHYMLGVGTQPIKNYATGVDRDDPEYTRMEMPYHALMIVGKI